MRLGRRRPLGQGHRRDVFVRAAPVPLLRRADRRRPERPDQPLRDGRVLGLSAGQDAHRRRRLRRSARSRCTRSSTGRAGAGVTRVHQLPEDKDCVLVANPTVRPRYRLHHDPAADRHRRRHDLPPRRTTSTSRSSTSTRSSSGTSRSRQRPVRPIRRRRSTSSTPASRTTSRSSGRSSVAGARVGAAIAQVAVDARDRPARQLADAQRGHQLGRAPGQRQAPANRGRRRTGSIRSMTRR